MNDEGRKEREGGGREGGRDGKAAWRTRAGNAEPFGMQLRDEGASEAVWVIVGAVGGSVRRCPGL